MLETTTAEALRAIVILERVRPTRETESVALVRRQQRRDCHFCDKYTEITRYVVTVRRALHCWLPTLFKAIVTVRR